jgi:hypothetical protein
VESRARARHPAADDAGREEWARLLARWDVAPGSPSERALATAVLLDAPLHPVAVRRVAAVVLTTFDPTGGGTIPADPLASGS